MVAMETGATTPSEQPLADVLTLPAHGEVLPDARGGGRWVRVSWHQEADLVVLSLWREGTCVGTAQITRDNIPVMVNALISGLAGTPTRD